MDKTLFSVRLHYMGDSLDFTIDVDTILSPEETLVPDVRAGVTPAEMADRKLSAALDGAAAGGPYTASGFMGASRRGIFQPVRWPEDEKERTHVQTPAEPCDPGTVGSDWTNDCNANNRRLRRPGAQRPVGLRGRHSVPRLPEMGDRG